MIGQPANLWRNIRDLARVLAMLWALLGAAAFGAELRIPNAKCVAVHDGDTLRFQAKLRVTVEGATIDGKKIHDVEIPFVVQIRLVDLTDPRKTRGCWAPELWEPGGFASRDSLRRMALNKTGTLLIDLDRAFSSRGPYMNIADVSRLSHMSRYFGDFYVPGYNSTVARRQIKARHAWATKDEQLEARR